jgi:hypothetical protein
MYERYEFIWPYNLYVKSVLLDKIARVPLRSAFLNDNLKK